MTRGETVLRERCRYLVCRPTEIFLKEGEPAPQKSAKPATKAVIRAVITLVSKPRFAPGTLVPKLPFDWVETKIFVAGLLIFGRRAMV